MSDEVGPIRQHGGRRVVVSAVIFEFHRSQSERAAEADEVTRNYDLLHGKQFGGPPTPAPMSGL